MTVKIADFDIKIKAGPADGLAEGQFSAYASVFGNRDSYGDVVVAGAFEETLAEWSASGDAIPLLFGHNMSDPDFNIGHVVDATEDAKGLLVTCQLDLESTKGAQTYRLLKGRRIRQMSFAYDVLDGAFAELDGEDVYELRRLKLYEVSLVTVGANQETEILAVKAASTLAESVKAGRVLAQKHIDSLRTAQEAIGAVIDAAEANDQEKASEPASAKSDDEPRDGGAKSDEEPTPRASADVFLAVIRSTEKGL